MIFLACDHAGFYYKEKLAKVFIKNNISFIDMGSKEYNKDDDYPDYVITAVNEVLKDKSNIGIFICGSGVGVNMVANRFKGIRAVLGYNKKIVKLARFHEDANVLCLGAKMISFKKAKKLVECFLTSPFENAERHLRRISKF